MAAIKKRVLSTMLAVIAAFALSAAVLPCTALANDGDYDVKDLANGWLEVDGPQLIKHLTFAYTGSGVEIQAKVYGAEVESGGEWANPVLEFGVDYTLSFKDAEDIVLLSAPSEIGSYSLVATGIGEYSGTTEVWFDIVDAYDITVCDFELLPGWDVLQGTIPTVEVYMGGAKLIEGTDYSLGSFLDEEGNPVVDFASAAPGSYLIEVAGIAPYHGTMGLGVTVYAPNDLAYATIWHDGEEIYHLDVDYTGTPLEIDVVLKGADGSTLQAGVDYAVRYYDEDENLLNDAPTETGFYQVKFEGIKWGYTTMSVSIVETEGPAAPDGSDSTNGENEPGLSQTGDATPTTAIVLSALAALSMTAIFALRRKAA